MGQLEGGAFSALFAASHPERVTHLVLYAAFARAVRDAGYEWAPTKAAPRACRKDIRRVGHGQAAGCVRAVAVGRRVDAALDGALRARIGIARRRSSVPRGDGDLDVRVVLPSIRVPTLILQRADDPFIDMRHAEYLAEHIPGSRLVLLPDA